MQACVATYAGCAPQRLASTPAINQGQARGCGCLAGRPAQAARRRHSALAQAARRCHSAAPRCEAVQPAIAELHVTAAGVGTEALFQPLRLGGGGYELKHRLIMAPLTRTRALGGVPQPNMVEYYRQRGE